MPKDNFADLILYNADVFYPHKEDEPTTVAIKNDRIIFVGNEADSKRLIHKNTELIDCNNKTIVPGFFDSHCHAFMGGRLLNTCLLTKGKNKDEYFQIIQNYQKEHSEAEYILGFGWRHSPFKSIGPSKEDLDRLIPDKPAIFLSIDYHSAWVNSKALQLASINEKTSDPSGGHIERKPDSNEPHGCLREMPTIRMVTMKLPPLQKEDWKHAMRNYMSMAAKHGITSVFDAGILNTKQETAFAAACELDRENKLNLRIRQSYVCNPDLGVKQIPKLLAAKKNFQSENFSLNVAKIFMDGAIEGHTGFLLKPYKDEKGYRGKPVWEKDNLKKTSLELHKNGFQIHVHAIGDGATRNTLEGLEYAQMNCKRKDPRHTIAHLELVNKKDISKFANLGVVASFQPAWFYMDENYFKETIPLLSQPRANERYLLEDFKKHDVKIAFGSDFPWGTVSSSMSPIKNIGTAVTRISQDKKKENIYEPEEKIDLETAIRYHTLGGAYQNFLENTTGSIEKGKKADLVLLNRNLFAEDINYLYETKVEMTIFDGKVIYKK